MERLHPPPSLEPNTPLRSGPTNQPGTLKKGAMPFMPLEIILIPYMSLVSYYVIDTKFFSLYVIQGHTRDELYFLMT